jgi:hypothetical protein
MDLYMRSRTGLHTRSEREHTNDAGSSAGIQLGQQISSYEV